MSREGDRAERGHRGFAFRIHGAPFRAFFFDASRIALYDVAHGCKIHSSTPEVVEMTRPQRALQIWQLLIGASRVRQTLTYSMVADLIGMGAGTLSQPLELVMRYCECNGLPPLTVLVVNQETGRPGAGLSTLEELNRD